MRSGRIYKASGRAAPIMDALAIHPYPNPNARPQPAPADAGYQDPGFYGLPQLDRVKQAVFDAFDGTAQPTTQNGLRLVLDEIGYQTVTDGDGRYSGTETSPTVSEADQASYYATIVGMAACDPAVSDVLFFHLIDESQRNPDQSSGGWQSGLEYPDGGHKPSFDAVKQAIAAGCAGSPVQWSPGSTGSTSGGSTSGGSTTAGGTTTSANLASTTWYTSPISPSDVPLTQATDGSLEWSADLTAPEDTTVSIQDLAGAWTSATSASGTASLKKGDPVVLDVTSKLEPGHHLLVFTLTGASGWGRTFVVDAWVKQLFPKPVAKAPVPLVQDWDGTLHWQANVAVPEAASVTMTAKTADGTTVSWPGTDIAPGAPVDFTLQSTPAPGTYGGVTAVVRLKSDPQSGMSFAGPDFRVLPRQPAAASPGASLSLRWKQATDGSLSFATDGSVVTASPLVVRTFVTAAAGGTPALIMDRLLPAGSPLAFWLDDKLLRAGSYTACMRVIAADLAGSTPNTSWISAGCLRFTQRQGSQAGIWAPPLDLGSYTVVRLADGTRTTYAVRRPTARPLPVATTLTSASVRCSAGAAANCDVSVKGPRMGAWTITASTLVPASEASLAQPKLVARLRKLPFSYLMSSNGQRAAILRAIGASALDGRLTGLGPAFVQGVVALERAVPAFGTRLGLRQASVSRRPAARPLEATLSYGSAIGLVAPGKQAVATFAARNVRAGRYLVVTIIQSTKNPKARAVFLSQPVTVGSTSKPKPKPKKK